MATRPRIEVDPHGDTGSHRLTTAAPRTGSGDRPSARRRTRRPERAEALVWALAALHAAVFAWLSVARHHAFATGRFDLGNMVQAVWSTTEGRFLESTDVSGEQFSRLGAHVDPILALFAPLWMVWPAPEMLLVVQAVVVASGALPAYRLGRRWLGDRRLAVAGAAVYLLFPALQSAVLFDFHPVTLAAPLLLFCIWAAEEGRWVTLGVCAALAAVCQEQVGLLIVMLAVWMWFRHPSRRLGAALLAAGAAAWVVVANAVVMPAFALDGTSPHIGRYERLGDGPGEIIRTALTRPWEVVEIIATPGRAGYLLSLLVPLFLLPLAAPLLAAVAVPQLLINLLASSGPAQSVEYHYAVLLVPVLVAAAMLGLARLRARTGAGRGEGPLARPGRVAAAMVGAVALAGVWQGPLPLWGWVPGGWDGSPLHQFTKDAEARAIAHAVDRVPERAAVSATNSAGAHLSARRRINLFPNLAGTRWALVVDSERARRVAHDRPTLRPPGTRARIRQLRTSPLWRLVFEEGDVRLYQRVPRRLS
ncbi:DUF2079 domain-containing protein [Miltoncostaea marina]|uniref:DUF2079 domain-containing protein n=1 Tax=Miltoncostaea marina TaxID=2843215 RepID=UPI001C3C6EFB|nr:DUF2079 domain-containing protein [Miltoncostaea marina]